jgi:hypothetical protein
MLKKGIDDDDEVDDEVRTAVPSQNHATATLSTDEFFLRTQYLQLSTDRYEGGTGNRQST